MLSFLPQMSYRNVKDRDRGPNPGAASLYLDRRAGRALGPSRPRAEFTIQRTISREPTRLFPAGGGEYRARTGDLLVANQALSQLS